MHTEACGRQLSELQRRGCKMGRKHGPSEPATTRRLAEASRCNQVLLALTMCPASPRATALQTCLFPAGGAVDPPLSQEHPVVIPPCAPMLLTPFTGCATSLFLNVTVEAAVISFPDGFLLGTGVAKCTARGMCPRWSPDGRWSRSVRWTLRVAFGGRGIVGKRRVRGPCRGHPCTWNPECCRHVSLL